jgi:hypothetical protein
LQIKQKDKAFVQLLWDLFNEIGIVGAEPQLISAFLKETCRAVPLSGPAPGQTYSAYGFKTLTLPYFTELHSIWYVKKVDGKNFKVIPSNIDETLTPRALAYWLTSDGSYDKWEHCIRIYTNSFTPAEVDQLRAALLNNLNIESTRVSAGQKGKEQSIIRKPKREVGKVQGLVKPYIPNSMAYRVGL